jgi:tRNA pseudouridine13 synthase
VPGYATKMPPSPQTDTLRAILDNEGITLLDFRNEDSRAIDSAGGLHLLSISVPDLESEFVDRGLHLRFRLRKGSYATVVLREIMKNHPIERV